MVISSLRLLEELPCDRDHTLLLGRDQLERADGEVDRIAVGASWARVGDGHNDGFVVLGIGDLYLLATERGSSVGVAVAVDVYERNGYEVALRGRWNHAYP